MVSVREEARREKWDEVKYWFAMWLIGTRRSIIRMRLRGTCEFSSDLRGTFHHYSSTTHFFAPIFQPTPQAPFSEPFS